MQDRQRGEPRAAAVQEGLQGERTGVQTVRRVEDCFGGCGRGVPEQCGEEVEFVVAVDAEEG